MVREFELPACVIVKHANPCGVAVAGSIEQAYERALAADPVSAYGGVVVLNRPVGEALGEQLAEQFVEVLFAPGFDEAALALLTQKPATRILEDKERRARQPGRARPTSACSAALLVQERDSDIEDREGMEVVCGSPSEMAWGDLLFAWRVCKHVSSNAIVLAHDLQTIGDRRRPDEPRRLGADRARQGARARAPDRRRGAGLATRSSRSPTGRSSRSPRA